MVRVWFYNRQLGVDIRYAMSAVPRVGDDLELDGTSYKVEAVVWIVDPDMNEPLLGQRVDASVQVVVT